MKVTLNLENIVFEKATVRAAELGITLSELTSLALKTLLMTQSKNIREALKT